MKKRMLTGLQPTGVITLGNYVGAIKQMVKYQDEYDSYLFVADMHAITIPQDPKELSKNIRSLIALYLPFSHFQCRLLHRGARPRGFLSGNHIKIPLRSTKANGRLTRNNTTTDSS